MTPLLIAHIAAAGAGIGSGAVAVAVPKGEPLHRFFGTAFFASMLLMSALGAWLAWLMPQHASVAVGALTFYLVATAWAAARNHSGKAGLFDRAAVLAPLGVAAALLTWGNAAREAASGTFEAFPPAPYFVFAGFAAFAALMDFKVILKRTLGEKQRVARHLWRMCFALFFAFSFFFIGKQKDLPHFIQGSPVLYVLALAPLVLLVFWMVRVRLTGWLARRET